MLIATFADFHLGVKTFGVLDEITGLNTREINALCSLDKFIDDCIEKQVDVINFAGDMFKNSLPSPLIQNELNIRIKRIIDANITLIMIDGNHDVSKLETSVSALVYPTTFNIPNVVHTRFHKEYVVEKNNEKIKFVLLPTHHNPDEIKQIVENTIYTGEPIVFVCHGTIAGASLNDWLIIENEKCIDLNIFKKPNISAVILGHLHKYQILSTDPLIYYTGSLQRIDFSEEDQEKGYVLLKIDMDGKVKHKFYPIDSQKFCTIQYKSTEGLNTQDELLKLIHQNCEKIQDAVLRINLELEEGEVLDEDLIIKEVNDFNPFYFSNIHKTYNWKRKNRNVALTENISVKSGLNLYYQNKPRAEERIKLGQQIIESVGL